MVLKIVYKICCGIDVHKTFVVACIASTNSKGVTTYESHRFSTYTSGLKDLLKQPPKDGLVVMRSREWIPSTIHFQSYSSMEQKSSILSIIIIYYLKLDCH